MLGTPSCKRTGSFCRVPWPEFARTPWYVLPVYLCRFTVRSASQSLEVFLGRISSFLRSITVLAITSRLRGGGFAYPLYLEAWTGNRHPAKVLIRRYPFVQTHEPGAGILTGCPSPNPFGIGLGPPYPGRISLPQETLGIRGPGFLPDLRYLCRHSLFHVVHGSSRNRFGLAWNALLPPWLVPKSAASAPDLSPVKFLAHRR